jgi:hypothetical protein
VHRVAAGVAPTVTNRDRDGAVVDRLVWVAHQSALDEVIEMTMSSLHTMNLGSESAAATYPPVEPHASQFTQ